MRTIETHKVDFSFLRPGVFLFGVIEGCSEAIEITAVDEPGCGGACHHYVMKFTNKHGHREAWGIGFQDGPIDEAGVNGVTHEALLAILIDRLEGFQRGPYACNENARALRYLVNALDILKERTRERVVRGVEGTHKP